VVVALDRLLILVAVLGHSWEAKAGLNTDATEQPIMTRRSETCPNCDYNFNYNEATGTGPSEFMSEG